MCTLFVSRLCPRRHLHCVPHNADTDSAHSPIVACRNPLCRVEDIVVLQLVKVPFLISQRRRCIVLLRCGNVMHPFALVAVLVAGTLLLPLCEGASHCGRTIGWPLPDVCCRVDASAEAVHRS
jgi:hypothetical protein